MAADILNNFLVKEFFPPSFCIENTNQISTLCKPYVLTWCHERVAKDNQSKVLIPNIQTSITHQTTATVKAIQERPLKTVKLDKRSWAFWSVWIAFYGLEEYAKIPENKRMARWLEEKQTMSVWYQDNYSTAKKEVGKYWDKLSNAEMEDAITSLVTDADEIFDGLKICVLCWVYYACSEIFYNSCSNLSQPFVRKLFCVYPGKSVYFAFTGFTISEEQNVVKENTVGIFIDDQIVCRVLSDGEAVEICESMVAMKSVNKKHWSIGKYTATELADICAKLGLVGKGEKCKKQELFSRLEGFFSSVHLRQTDAPKMDAKLINAKKNMGS